MKKKISIIAAILAGVIILLILIPLLFKGPITRMIKKEINKSLVATVDFSDVSISLIKNFPEITVGLHDLTIVGHSTFEGDTLAFVQKMMMSFNPFDLIRGNYIVKRVKMVSPDVLLKISADGSVNWDIVKTEESTTSEPVAEEENLILKLNKVIIEDGFMIYKDASIGFNLSLDSLDAEITGNLSEQQTNLDILADMSSVYVDYDGISYLSGARISFKGGVDVDLTQSSYSFLKNKIFLNDLGIELDGKIIYLDEYQYYDLSFAAPSDDFKQFLSLIPAIYSRDFNSVNASGKLGFNGFVKGRYDDQTFPGFNVNIKVDQGRFQYESLPAAVEDIELDATLRSEEGSLDNLVTDIRNMSFSILNNPFSVRLFLERPLDDLNIDAAIKGSIDLSNIKSFYPLREGEQLSGNISIDAAFKGKSSSIETGDFEANGSMSVRDVLYKTPQLPRDVIIRSAELEFGPENFALNQFEVGFGQSSLSAEGKLKNYLGYFLKDQQLSGNLSMSSPYLDLNEILAYGTNSPDTAITDSVSFSVFEVPANITFDIDATISKLMYGSMSMSDIKAMIRVNDKKIRLERLNAEMYSSKLDLKGEYDTWDVSAPLINLEMKIQNLQIKDAYDHFFLVRQYLPLAKNAQGALTMEMNFASLLDQNMKLVLGSLAGKGSVKSDGIVLKEINSLDLIDKALNTNVFKNISSGPVNISFQFVDGMLNVPPFDLKAGKVDLNLSGWTGFDTEIGYDLKMKIKKDAFGSQVNSVINDLQSKYGLDQVKALQSDHITISAFIGGTLTNPELTLGTKDMGTNVLEILKEEGKEQLEQQVENVKEEASKILEQADQQAKAIIDEAQKQVDAIMASAEQLAAQTRKETDDKAKMIEDEGKKQGQLAALAAKKTADKVKQEGYKQADNIISEARGKSDQILKEARAQADKIKADADERVKNL